MRPALCSYDHVLVATSGGGKDSVAALIWLLDEEIDPARIELHHHEVDGRGEPFMDWPSTPGYCRAIANAFGLPIYFSWREGGFLCEMLRDGQPTAKVLFETPADGVRGIGGRGPIGTRLRFPQVSADLSVRWCSSVAKIGPMDTLIRNQDRFLDSRTLVVTGERSEESPARPATRRSSRTEATHARDHDDDVTSTASGRSMPGASARSGPPCVGTASFPLRPIALGGHACRVSPAFSGRHRNGRRSARSPPPGSSASPATKTASAARSSAADPCATWPIEAARSRPP